MKNRDAFVNVVAILILVLCSFALTTCDLLNSKPEDDLIEQIDSSVAWANAERLTVRVAYPWAWGNSPQQGTMSSDGTRKGFAFSVEFNAANEYGFGEWKAFKNDDYKGSSTNVNDALDARYVQFSSTTEKTDVTIYTSEPLTLVPWCVKRPEVNTDYSTPNSLTTTFYTNQPLRIYFTEPVDEASAESWDNITVYNTVTKEVISGIGGYFKQPVYEDALNFLLVEVDRVAHPMGVPADSYFTVEIGENIRHRDYPNVTIVAGKLQYRTKAGGINDTRPTLDSLRGAKYKETGYVAGDLFTARKVLNDTGDPVQFYVLFRAEQPNSEADAVNLANAWIEEAGTVTVPSSPFELDWDLDNKNTAGTVENVFYNNTAGSTKPPYSILYTIDSQQGEGDITLSVEAENDLAFRSTPPATLQVRLNKSPNISALNPVLSYDWAAGAVSASWTGIDYNAVDKYFHDELGDEAAIGDGYIEISYKVGDVDQTPVRVTYNSAAGSDWAKKAGALTGTAKTSSDQTVTITRIKAVDAYGLEAEKTEGFEPFTNTKLYTITFNGNSSTSGTVPSAWTQTATNGAYPLPSPSLLRTNYAFVGWNTKQDGTGTDYAAGYSFTPDSDITLYAKWGLPTVTFDGNDNTGGTAPEPKTPASAGAAIILPGQGTGEAKLVNGNYAFGGWNTKEDGTGTNYAAGSSYIPAGNITLYARWRFYIVTFNGNGDDGNGTPPAPIEQASYNAYITVPGNTGNLFRSGGVFEGWNTRSDGSGTTYTAYDTFRPASDVTLYAKWRPCVVTFDDNGADLWYYQPLAPMSPSSVGGSIILPEVGWGKQEGGEYYGAAGWRTEANGGTGYEEGAEFTPTTDCTLYVWWRN